MCRYERLMQRYHYQRMIEERVSYPTPSWNPPLRTAEDTTGTGGKTSVFMCVMLLCRKSLHLLATGEKIYHNIVNLEETWTLG